MNTFNPVEYWKNKSPKKWVVTLRAVGKTDKRYIQAETELGAIETAKSIARLKSCEAIARLATPSDLEAKAW